MQHENMMFSVGEICLIIYGFDLCFGTTLMDQLWARKQSVLAWRWGMTNLEVTEEQRPEFIGDYMRDEISGKNKKVKEMTKGDRFKRFLGYSVIFMFILAVIAILIALFIYKSTLKGSSYGPKIVGTLTACQIKVLNYVRTI